MNMSFFLNFSVVHLSRLLGPDHMTILIWPVQGVEMIGWSAGKELPHADSFYTERPLYFVTYFYGVQPTVPYELTITLKVGTASR